MAAFSGDTYLKHHIHDLIKKHHVKTVVETGTFLGESTLAFADMIPKVHTIENNAQFASVADKKFSDKPGITLHRGSSPEVLHALCPKLKTDTLYFLDAHWYDYWPLLDELTEIAQNPAICKIIVIHDFVVPNTTLGYDSYIPPTTYKGLNLVMSLLDMMMRTIAPKASEVILHKQKLDWQYIEDHIRKINPKFAYHYNSKASGRKRGVIFIEFTD